MYSERNAILDEVEGALPPSRSRKRLNDEETEEVDALYLLYRSDPAAARDAYIKRMDELSTPSRLQDERSRALRDVLLITMQKCEAVFMR